MVTGQFIAEIATEQCETIDVLQGDSSQKKILLG